MPQPILPPSDVAIVGFGPTGAVCAGLLARRSLTVQVIERTVDVYDRPRAIALDHEILRIFDNLGVLSAVTPHLAPFTASEHFGADGQLIRRIDMAPTPFPLGYTPSMVFSQPPVERALRDHVAAMPGVRLLTGHGVVALHQDDVGVTLTLSDESTVACRFAVGCDGASSTLRQLCRLPVDDLVFDEPWLVVDLLVDDAALPGLPACSAQYCDPARPVSYIVGPGNHRRWEIMLLPGEDRQRMEHPDQVWALLAPWIAPHQARLWRAASYRFHALVAHDWRAGRVFIAGDAAHQQPPFIGQGMCQGLRDAANLSWKLAQVLTGATPLAQAEALLDSYATERAAHVRTLTSRIKTIGQAICERDPAAARVRDAALLAHGGGQAPVITRQQIVPPLITGALDDGTHPARGTLCPQPRIATPSGPVLLDTLLGDGWYLLRDARSMPSDHGHPGAAIGPDPAPGVLTELDGVMKAWFDRYACCAALVRPDHYVFGVAAAPDEVAALLHRAVPWRAHPTHRQDTAA